MSTLTKTKKNIFKHYIIFASLHFYLIYPIITFNPGKTTYNREFVARRFPGLSRDAAQWIVDSGKVYGVGVDGPSVDPGRSTTFEAHGVLSKANLYNLENVALNGTTLPPRGFKLVIQPVKIVDGTGGPVRILAFTNNPFK